MRYLIRAIICLALIAAALLIARWLINTREEPAHRSPPPTVTKVEAQTLRPTDYQVVIQSQGTVRPRTEGALVPEVAGRIVEVDPSFREGGFFEEGDVLLRIDPLDYQTAVVVAEGQIAQAQSELSQEQARADQAMENWERLGKTGEPGDLVLRKPQLAEARARLTSAQAQLERARRDLAKTEVRAPYAGRIVEKSVDFGQFVTATSPLAMIYATDYVEVRLPLNNEDLAFIDLPEAFRNEDDSAEPTADIPVTLRGQIGGEEAVWEGRIIRVSGEIDRRSRQLFVVAQVNDPYGKREDGLPPLKVGLFVEAEITGRTLGGVFVLPANTVRPDGEVILIEPGASTILRQPVEALFANGQEVVVGNTEGSGISDGAILCLTPLAYPTNGAKVAATIDGKAPPAPAGPSGAPGMPAPDPAPAGVPGAPPSFASLDANEDGRITPDEAPDRMRGRWERLDSNGDGHLGPDEFPPKR